MIILDTNVVSELMRERPDDRVRAWLDRLPRLDLWITAVSIFELRFGIELHATGRRRARLEDSVNQMLAAEFRGRILDFDGKAATAAAAFAAGQRRAGHSHEVRDTFIAGIVVSRDAELATRNVRHFRSLGLRIIDPWTA